MKKLRTLMVGIIAIIVLLIAGAAALNRSSGMSGAKVVNIYNWGDYIDPELITKFEKQTGYKINYETFDSNEAMLTKIKQGGTAYDLAVPSDYMIQKMKKAHLLKPLDKSKIHGMGNISPQFLDQPFDRGNRYSIPYFWGTLGVVYNDRYYRESDVDSWNKLWDDKFRGQIMFVDGAREFMGIGLASLGYSLNSRNDARINRAYDRLKSLTGNVKAIVSDEIKMYMENEEGRVAVTYSGEASEMLAENSHLHYVIPSEGTNLWFDNIVIPKTARNMKGAYAFINFMLEPENAAKNAEYIGYATPNVRAMKYLPKSVTGDRQFYPSQLLLKKMEVYEDLGPACIEKYNDLYLELKMYRH